MCLQPGNEMAALRVERGPVAEVVVTLVEYIGGARLDRKPLGRGDVVDPHRSHRNAGRHVALRVVNHMRLDATLLLPVSDPLADHDPGGVDQAQHLAPPPTRRQPAQLPDQCFKHIFKQGRRALTVRIRQGRAAHRLQTEMGMAARKPLQRRLHLAQRPRPRHLRIHHRQKLRPGWKTTNPMVRTMAPNQSLKTPARKRLHQTPKYRILIAHGLGSNPSFDSTGLFKTKLNPSHAPCPPKLNRTAVLVPVGPQVPPTRGSPPAARRARRPARGALLWTTETSYRRASGTFLRRRSGA